MEGKKRGCPCYILPWAGSMIRLFLANHSRRAGCMNTSAAGVLNREILSEDGNLPFFLLGPIDRNIGSYYTYTSYLYR